MKFWQDRPVFVTGASGFLGGWLVRYLIDQKADVVTLLRDWVPQSELVRQDLIDRVKMVKGDVCDQALLERVLGEYEVEVVFHLAAQTIVSVANRNPVSTFESDIKGTWSLLEACRRSPKIQAIVVASSDKAYKPDAPLPFTERTPLHGLNPYDASKSSVDIITQAYGSTYKLPVAITRCGNIYGGGDLNWSRIVPGTIRSILRNQRPVIRSNGKYIRDYFYVADTTSACVSLAQKLVSSPVLAGEAFNFSNGTPVTVLEIVNKILLLMESGLKPKILNDVSNEIYAQYLDAEKAKSMLGWEPKYSLDDGIKDTIEWYRRFFDEN